MIVYQVESTFSSDIIRVIKLRSREICLIKCFTIYRLLQTLVRNQVQENEIDVDFSTCARDEKYVEKLIGRNRKERKLGIPMCKSEIIIEMELKVPPVVRIYESDNEDSNFIK
jgi:hypothetical protein